jgi:hypothetical protein
MLTSKSATIARSTLPYLAAFIALSAALLTVWLVLAVTS